MKFAAWTQRFQRGCCSFTPLRACWYRKLASTNGLDRYGARCRAKCQRRYARQSASGAAVIKLSAALKKRGWPMLIAPVAGAPASRTDDGPAGLGVSESAAG